jgi:hypothetical protein
MQIMTLMNLDTESLLFKSMVLSGSQKKLNGEFKMQNKKDKRTKANGKKLETDAGKTVASGSADAKKGVADVGKKGAQGTTGGKKGWKK